MFEDKEGFILPLQVDVGQIGSCSLLDLVRSHTRYMYREAGQNDTLTPGTMLEELQTQSGKR